MIARFSMIAVLLSLLACDSNALDECTSTSVGGCDSVQTCCNSTECYFVVDGEEFPCANGKECDAAVAKVEAYCSNAAR